MTPDRERWRQIRQVFDSACELPPAARRLYLERQCGTDIELRAEVEKLLSSHDELGDFIQQPAGRELSGVGPDRAGTVPIIGPRYMDNMPWKRRRWLAAGAMGTLAAGGIVWLGSRIFWPRQQPVVLRFWVESPGQPAGRISRVRLNRLFQPGDRIRFQFQLQVGGYLYLVNQVATPAGPRSPLNLLFPGAGGRLSEHQLGQFLSVPQEPDNWIHFDEESGEEEIWLFWSRSPLEVLESARIHSREPRWGELPDDAGARVRELADSLSQDMVGPSLQENERYVFRSSTNRFLSKIRLHKRGKAGTAHDLANPFRPACFAADAGLSVRPLMERPGSAR